MRHGLGRTPWSTAIVLVGVAASTSCSTVGSNVSTTPTLNLSDRVETMTGAQLWDFLLDNGIQFDHGTVSDRKCGATANRDCSARFDIAYLPQGQNKLHPDPWNGTARGTIVGRVVSYGPKDGGNDEPEFRYKAEKRGGKRHFIVIATARDGVKEYWVRRVTPKDASTTALASGTWVNCGHSDGPKQVKSRFATCSAAHSSQSTSAAVLHSHELSPGWIECESSGCCTAGQ